MRSGNELFSNKNGEDVLHRRPFENANYYCVANENNSLCCTQANNACLEVPGEGRGSSLASIRVESDDYMQPVKITAYSGKGCTGAASVIPPVAIVEQSMLGQMQCGVGQGCQLIDISEVPVPPR